MTAKTGLTTGIVVLLSLGTLLTGTAGASAADCPEGIAPIVDVDGNPQCVAVDGTVPEPTPPPTAPPTPPPTTPPTPPPTDLPPPGEPGTVPPEEPAPSVVPESTPAVIDPPRVTAPAPPETVTETPAPASTAPTGTPAEQKPTGTPTPAVVPPEPPANADTTAVIVPDGPRLLWAVVAGASGSALLAALLAFYLVSVRPFITARRRPGALG